MSTATQQEVTIPATSRSGNFVWYELRTTDAKAAGEFYSHVIGWQTKGSGNPGGVPYMLFTINGHDTAGLMELMPEMLAGGMRPAWVGFVGVDDVDAYAKRLHDAGGKLHCPAQDIPGIGRWASVEDPQGAAFMLFKGAPEYAQPRLPMGSVGTVGWHELSANDGPAVWRFYSELFDWQKDTAMDMGPMGVYQIFNHGGPQLGAVMTRDPKMSPVPFWLYYLAVEEIEAATARIGEKGGLILMGPHEVPGSQWIVLGKDPQGALFAVVGPKK
jgi:predicted enzyme related to lactoylglutathione lyase